MITKYLNGQQEDYEHLAVLGACLAEGGGGCCGGGGQEQKADAAASWPCICDWHVSTWLFLLWWETGAGTAAVVG